MTGTEAADEAVELFVYRTAAEVAAMASAIGGLDALVFTAGIGERSPPIGARIAARCRWVGIELDAAANDAGGPRISTDAAPVSTWVIPTDEERVIAGQALDLVRASCRDLRRPRRIPAPRRLGGP
jgi:acetate kinase